ncbi:MAG TPA: thioesterase family protein [Burkholderiales bacterium]|nr:thioesterase family protein [Burkholderiales bacterium]
MINVPGEGDDAMQLPGRLVHVEHMKMRWADMDALGHMNNTVYFRCLEQARISWFDGLGVDYAQRKEGPILGSVSCRFRIPIVYPADLAVSLYAGQPRNSSFALSSAISDAKQPERVYATGEAVMVWIDLADGKARPLPQWLRQRLQQ